MIPRVVSRRRAAILLASIILGALVGLTASAAPSRDPGPPIDLSTRTGVGETILLVVAGQYATEADARDAAEQLSFGDMQGFYVDAAGNYTIVGAYDQTRADYQVVECQSIQQQTSSCTESTVRVALPVALKYIPVERFVDFFEADSNAICGEVGQRPCMAARIKNLLASPGDQFRSDTYLALTAFRTKKGAEEFVELARNRGFETSVVRTRKIGGPYVGLGQEANPDGVSGPLIDPLPNPDSFQR